MPALRLTAIYQGREHVLAERAEIVSARFLDEPAELLHARQALFAQAETRLRRRLHPAERNMDIVAIDRALEAGKARLHQAIEREKRRMIRELVTRNPYRPVLNLTRDMTAALLALHRAGRREALAEIQALGAKPATGYADEGLDVPVPPSLDVLLARLHGRLGLIARRAQVEAGAVAVKVEEGTLGEMSSALLAREVERLVPGALDAASRLVSSAFDAGRGDVFDLNSELIAGWVYTAVMDAATCDECEALDGTEYPSWDAIQEVLPGGGPNPACLGEGRCRCMAAPAAAA